MKALSFLLPLMLALSISACQDKDRTGSPPPPSLSAELATAVVQDIPIVAVTSGIVTVDQRVAVSSRLSGYIQDLAVREGERVRTGQLLLRVDAADVRSQLEQARARLSKAEASLADANVDLERYQALLAEQAVSQQQFDKVSLHHQLAQQQVREASEAVRQATNQLAYAEVRAPVAGIVVQKFKHSGDLALPGEPILVLEDPGHLLVETFVSEQQIEHLKPGDRVRVRLPATHQELVGGIGQIVQAADPVYHRFLVKISLPETKSLRPGMYAQVGFSIGHRRAVLIPARALVHRNDMPAVYVVGSDNLAHLRLLRLGEAVNEHIEVAAGMNPGERMVANKLAQVRSGMLIQGE